jgi:hypothetical protein
MSAFDELKATPEERSSPLGWLAPVPVVSQILTGPNVWKERSVVKVTDLESGTPQLQGPKWWYLYNLQVLKLH